MKRQRGSAGYADDWSHEMEQGNNDSPVMMNGAFEGSARE